MILIAHLFPNERTTKNVVRSICKKSRFRGLFEKQDGKPAKRLFMFERQHLYHILWSLLGEFSCKKSLLVIWKIFRLFVNTVTADDKYSLFNKHNSTQRIHMQLSQKQKIFSEFFSQRLKSNLNFDHFQKKMTLVDDVFPILWTPKNVLRSMSKKSRFREPFKQHNRKWVQ